MFAAGQKHGSLHCSWFSPFSGSPKNRSSFQAGWTWCRTGKQCRCLPLLWSCAIGNCIVPMSVLGTELFNDGQPIFLICETSHDGQPKPLVFSNEHVMIPVVMECCRLLYLLELLLILMHMMNIRKHCWRKCTLRQHFDWIISWICRSTW